jgi:uncharacterized membrane-anchored protein YjiN (DUF445 family)
MENCDGGFEAATIGGFADWFAVLCFMKFHLCPQAYKHYSQKQRKTDRRNSRFNKWLSPNVIAEKLDEVDLAKIIDFIQQPKHQQHGIRLIQKIVLKFKQLDNPIFANTLQKYLKNRSPR